MTTIKDVENTLKDVENTIKKIKETEDYKKNSSSSTWNYLYPGLYGAFFIPGTWNYLYPEYKL